MNIRHRAQGGGDKGIKVQFKVEVQSQRLRLNIFVNFHQCVVISQLLFVFIIINWNFREYCMQYIFTNSPMHPDSLFKFVQLTLLKAAFSDLNLFPFSGNLLSTIQKRAGRQRELIRKLASEWNLAMGKSEFLIQVQNHSKVKLGMKNLNFGLRAVNKLLWVEVCSCFLRLAFLSVFRPLVEF